VSEYAPPAPKKPEFNRCPVNGCGVQVEKPLVFCPPHFDRLPARMREQVTDLVESDPHGASTQMVIDVAVNELQEQESD
jgi:hypothetical protein